MAADELTPSESRPPDADPVRRRPSALVRLLAPVRGSLAVGIGLEILAAAASIVPYLAILGLTRAMAGAPLDPRAAWRWVIIYPMAVGLQAGVAGVALLITHFADVRLQALVRRDLADHLGRLPLGWFDVTGSGRVRKIVNDDVESLHHLVAHSVVEITAAVVTPVAGLVLCFLLDWRLGIAAVLPLILYMATYRLLSPGDMGRIMDQIAQGLARVSQAIVDYVGGVTVLKVFGRARSGSRRFRRTSEEFVEEFGDLVGPQMRSQAVSLLWLSAPVVALIVLAVGIWSAQSGWTEAGRVLAVALVALSLPSTLYTVAAANQARSEAREAAERVMALLDEPVLPQPVESRRPADASVEFDDVRFSYPAAPDLNGPGHAAVNGVSLRVPSGGSLALVGPSGAGKSTLALLAARFRDVSAGSVRIGGVDVREIDESTLRSTVGVVLQTVQLPALSIAENIALGRPDASHEQIVEVARAARIDDRIRRLPRGYDSVIGEDALLSGGEAQRVAIARALLQETPVLILDEATSAADPETEWEIQEALSQLVAGRTLVMIAHRLSTVEHVDTIAVIEDGRVVETGDHQELLARGGRYARMWNTQTEVLA